MAAVQTLGRERELAELKAFVASPDDGFGALVLRGEPGIGKTTLWQEALAEFERRGVGVLRCRAVELEGGLAYVSLGDLLEPARSRFEELPAPQRDALRRALLFETDTAAVADQRAVGLAVLALLRALARRPTVVAVDDAQWLDPSTALVLGFALRRIREEPVRLLATVRTDERATLLRRELLGESPVEMAIGPLEEGILEDLLQARLGVRFPPLASRRIYAASGGNPFFALEIAKEALRSGYASSAEPLPVPDDLLELVSARIGRLGDSVRSTLLVIAALSKPSLAMVEAVVGTDARPLVAQATEVGVLTFERRRFRFTHPLLAAAVYQRASEEERRSVHRRLADAIEDAEERGRHLALATSMPDSSVAAQLDLASAAARSRGAIDAAGALAEHAARLTPPEQIEDRARRVTEAADHYFLSGDIVRSRALVEGLATELDAGPGRARALQRLARAVALQVGFPVGEDLLQRALADARGDRFTTASVEHDLAHTLHQYGHLREALVHAESAVELAGQEGDAELCANARTTLQTVRFFLGGGIPTDSTFTTPATGRVDVSEISAAVMLKYADAFDDARVRFESVRDRLTRQGGEGQIVAILFQLAELECWTGHLEAAARYVNHLEKVTTSHAQRGLRTRTAYAAALVRAYAGRLSEANALAEEHLRVARRLRDDLLSIRFQALLGFVALSGGDMPAAATHLDAAATLFDDAGYAEPGVVRFAGDHVEALIACGRIDHALAALETLERRGRELGRTSATALAHRSRSLLEAASGELGGALAEARAAVAEHEVVGQPLELGRSLVALGVVQRRRKERSASRNTLGSAERIFASIGAAAWQARASEELGRVSGRARSPNRLTPTEERIAALAAAGRMNKEIAREVHLSIKTVEANLSSVYRKLDVRSRTQLAALFAARDG